MRRVSRFSVLAFAALRFGTPPLRPTLKTPGTRANFNFIEANVFGGVSDYANVDAGLGTRYSTTGLVGLRATENFWNYFALGRKRHGSLAASADLPGISLSPA